jgi:hypothetical protein
MEILMSPSEEKRSVPRFEFQKKVRLFPVRPSKSGHILEIQDTPLDSWANDISAAGLGLVGVRAFAPHTLVKMDIEGLDHKIVDAYGTIVWAYDNHAGVRFVLKDHRLSQKIEAIGLEQKNKFSR